MSLIIIILIIASLVLGVLFVHFKKVPFCLTLVIFEFIIFMILFIANMSDDLSLGKIYIDLAFSENYLIGKAAYPFLEYNDFKIFTFFTHMYLHKDALHILSNMLVLTLLGIPFERKIGSGYFIIIFYVSGILGSVISALFAVYSAEVFNLSAEGFSIGASGAIFGILGAFVALFPRDKVWFPLIIIRPWPIWLIAMIYFGFETILAAAGTGDHIGHFAHIGGLVSGVTVALIVGKFKAVRDEEIQKGIVDYRHLKRLATNNELKDIYLKIKDEDKPEIRNVWLEEFLTQAKCPKCGEKLIVKRSKAKCKCGYKIKY